MEALFVFLFSLSLPTQLGKHFFLPFSYLSGIRIDYLAPTVYLTDIFSLPLVYYALLYLLNLKNQFKIIQALSFLLIFLIFSNFYFALSKPLWLYGMARILQWGLIFFYFTLQGKVKQIYSAILCGLFIGGVGELILSLLQLSARHSIQGVWYYFGERSFTIFTPGIAKAYFLGREFLRSYGTFSHPNSLSGFYLLLYGFILTQKRITNIFFKITLLTLFSFLILISFSRTALITYVFINLLYFLSNSFTCKLCFFAKLATASIVLLFAFNVSGDLQSLNKRNDFVQKSIEIIAEKPFSGTGIGSYLIAQHKYPQRFSTFFEQPVHNIFLLAIAQLGIPLSLILLFTLFNRLNRVKIKDVSLLLPLLIIVLTGFMDHYWLTLQQNILVTALIFGVLYRYETKTS